MTNATPVEPPAGPVQDAGAPRRVAWTAVIAYVLLACGLAWLVALPLWLGDGLASPLTPLVLPAMMLTPAIAAVVVMLVCRVPRIDRLRFLGMWPLRPAGRLVLFLALGLVLPIAIVLAASLIGGAFGLVRLDLTEFSGFAAQLAAAAPAGTPMPPIGVMVALQLAIIPVGAVVNSVLAFGEELGWRGWLQTALLPLGTWPALLITGVAWGLWHAPVILLGYNFGRPDLVGVLLMVGGCVAWGILFGWLRLRSASLWPAVLAHGSLNAVGGVLLLFTAAGAIPDMALVGPLGVVAWGLVAATVLVIVLARQLRPGTPAAASGSPAPLTAEGESR